MQEQAATTSSDLPSDLDASTDSAAESGTPDPAIGARIRTSLALAQTRITAVPSRARAQIEDLPTQVREALDRLVARAQGSVRNALDLPSRGELAALLERVEALDAKLDSIDSSAANPDAKSTRGKAKKSPK